ncbi:DNA replication/repair protein RecF [Nocardioides terrisoli]|uniref:DNA replication/repair protein RecF n=1 Tax=Nocardioides terrisoli TaxID=3388267 RepID=UPI00287BB290|nr:DNA replication/repair protein RecF [Nocardioides marmorisolisilvae]
MYVAHLTLHDFRSWTDLDLELGAGTTSLVGRNGQGKTNVVEAVDYLSRLSSHRVAADAPLVRTGCSQAVVRAAVVRDDRRAVLEVEINPGRSNRARINSSPLPRARDLLGVLRSVVFAPDDLALVKGDPGERRRFLDDLLVQRSPRYAGTRADYDRVLKQRNSLLRSAGVTKGSRDAALATLEVWDERLAELGTEIMAARTQLIAELTPLLGKAYEAVARGAHRDDALLTYRPSFEDAQGKVAAFVAELERRRKDEFDRGLTLVGPHRDEMLCSLGDLPVKGYSSHGESWSFALALRLGSYELLRAPTSGDADDPVLVLDDVFAELDAGRRGQLAELVSGAEQVLVTAAVPEDIPEQLRGRRLSVADGQVRDA